MTEPIYCLGDGIGFTGLVQHWGDDAMNVHAARASFAAFDEEVSEERIVRMTAMMLAGHHGSVFEHSGLTVLTKTPLCVCVEHLRHRTQSFNAQSGRYSKMSPEFYVPVRVRGQVGKPGQYTFTLWDDQERADAVRRSIQRQSQSAYDMYESLLEEGVAKEQARLVLPQNLYVSYFATANLRNWLKFLELRTSEHAMWEIRQHALVIEGLIERLFPITHRAWVDNGRVAP